MQKVRRPELLAPVGDVERLQAAVQYGADAVYLGSSMFGMRASSAKFGGDELNRAVEYAHARGVKVYLTCNTVPKNQEMEQLPEFLKYAEKSGVDALIISDIGVLAMAKRVVPNMEIHISTQTGVVNYVTASELFHMGAKRVVLARELSLEDISRIREKTPPELEIEVFVHGAMCVSFSGRCLLSNYMTGRDANRGECAQPCRWSYHLVEEKRPGQYYQISEEEHGTYILNAKDLCMIEYLDQVIKAGASSLKIEGRAKSSYYVSVITNAYRVALNDYLNDPEHYRVQPWLLDEVEKVSHRQYCTGFFFGQPDNAQYYENGGYIRSYDVAALVDSCCNDGFLLCTQKNKFDIGDEVELLQPLQRPQPFRIEKIIGEDGEPLETARHPMMKVKISCPYPAISGSIIRKRK